ncbi:antichymotrypsin-2-like [Leptopilina heterotoma]|uniref:antichymotrypsin-2-like n=1 Tax=Leptopilina heterotoma TaxID=63436 RepID=UPI001CA992AB|nr:antichymotrypsin-2-like [Leptopilina heterotoma]
MRIQLLLIAVCLCLVQSIKLTSNGKEEDNLQPFEKCCNFAFRLYKTIARKFIGNIALAPFSAYDSLSLLFYGSGGNTAKQIHEVLNINSNDLSNHKTLTKSLTEDASFNFIQVLYIPDKVDIVPIFKELSNTTFITQQESLNFDQPEEAISVINKYFAERNLKRDLPYESDTFLPQHSDMFIRNSIQFSAQFLYPFNERYTEQRPFCRSRNSEKLVSTMFTRGRFRGIVVPPTNRYLDSFRIIEIPYKNREYSMLIYYPLNSYKLVELEQRLDTLDIRAIFNSREEDIELYLPKFTIQNEQRLKLTLTEMGITDAFSEKADFIGISKKPLRLDEIYVRTHFSLNENGINAEVSNNVGGHPVFATALPYTKPLTIEINRPFMFTVVKKGKDDILCLFNGRVYNP